MSTTDIKILVINPNSSVSMTEGIRKAIDSIATTSNFVNCKFEWFTARLSPAPPSINDGKDLEDSTASVLPFLNNGDLSILRDHDAVLIACYSVHPLVIRMAVQNWGRKPVLGIFEASVLSALSLISPYPGNGATIWGIVTTGKFWEAHLNDGVRAFLGQDSQSANSKFAGVFTTGLDASDFHGGVSPELVDAKLKDATRRLLGIGRVGCIVMGCAGMAGLEDIIRGVVTEVYGENERVYVVDGVKAGASMLLEAVRNARMFA